MQNNPNLSVGVAVITHNSKHHLRYCLPPVLQSSVKPRVLVVNSSSHDGTVEEARRLGAETLVIPRDQFNHGVTREVARNYLGTDIVLMLTPDAYAVDDLLVETLIQPIVENETSIAYARQIPHHGAGFFESFSRNFNYPETSQVRGIEDVETFGVYTFFCSNSCCAWKNSALDEIGGFQHVLLGEDTVAVAKLLQKGHRIAYVSDAIVRHSHRYGLKQEFQRHYDTGLARKEYGALLSIAGKDSKRGRAYSFALFSELFKKDPLKLPYAAIQLAAKFVGYHLGRLTVRAPRGIKKVFSSQDFFWNSLR